MTELHKINVNLSEGQKRKLMKAYRDNEEVSIRLAHSDLSGSDVLLVPSNTVKRVAKSRASGKGVQIKIAKNNVRKQTGEGIFMLLEGKVLEEVDLELVDRVEVQHQELECRWHHLLILAVGVVAEPEVKKKRPKKKAKVYY